METLPGTQATGASSSSRLVVSCQTREPSLPGVWELASCSVGLPEPAGRRVPQQEWRAEEDDADLFVTHVSNCFCNYLEMEDI